jgi:hypothetical protein
MYLGGERPIYMSTKVQKFRQMADEVCLLYGTGYFGLGKSSVVHLII